LRPDCPRARIRQAPFRPGFTAWCTNSLTALLDIRTRYPNERHNFFRDRISAHQRMAVQGTHQRIVPISRPFFHFISTKSATLQFCSVALSLRTDEQRKKKGNL
jgi:hypothetical protein